MPHSEPQTVELVPVDLDREREALVMAWNGAMLADRPDVAARVLARLHAHDRAVQAQEEPCTSTS